MDSGQKLDLNHALLTLKNPFSWFFSQGELIKRKKALQTIEWKGDFRMIPSLYAFYLKVPGNLVIEAIRPMKNLLADAPLDQPQIIYREFKHLHFDLWQIDDFMRLPSSDAICLLSLASVNSNGFIREKALRYLSNFTPPEVVPFILYRLADWVPDIASIAPRILPQYLKPKYAPIFIKYYRLLNWLLDTKRNDLKPVVHSIIEILTDVSSQEHIIAEFDSSNSAQKRFLIKILLKSDPILAIRKALKSSDFLIKLAVIPAVPKLDYASSILFLDSFLRDKSGPVRLATLQAIPSDEFDRFKTVIYELLHDSMGYVRAVARTIISRTGFINFSPIYRTAIENNQVKAGSLLGLAETGKKEDVELIRPFLKHENKRIMAAAIRALEQLEDEELLQSITSYLTTPNRFVKKSAQRIIINNMDREKVLELRDLLKRSDFQTKKVVLSILTKKGGWESIVDILYAILYAEKELSRIAWDYIPVWLKRIRNIFLEPNKEDQNQARDLLFAIKIAGIPIPKQMELYWQKLEEVLI